MRAVRVAGAVVAPSPRLKARSTIVPCPPLGIVAGRTLVFKFHQGEAAPAYAETASIAMPITERDRNRFFKYALNMVIGVSSGCGRLSWPAWPSPASF